MSIPLADLIEFHKLIRIHSILISIELDPSIQLLLQRLLAHIGQYPLLKLDLALLLQPQLCFCIFFGMLTEPLLVLFGNYQTRLPLGFENQWALFLSKSKCFYV